MLCGCTSNVLMTTTQPRGSYSTLRSNGNIRYNSLAYFSSEIRIMTVKKNYILIIVQMHFVYFRCPLTYFLAAGENKEFLLLLFDIVYTIYGFLSLKVKTYFKSKVESGAIC